MPAITYATQPVDFLKILAHKLRWKLVTALSQSDYRVQELVEMLHQPQNLVSYHLRLLSDLQLVTEHRSTADGRDVYYSLDLVQMHRMLKAVGQALHPALNGDQADLEGLRVTHSSTQARILCLCTENSARSQMAEGILRHLGGILVDVFSAGTAPSKVHPDAVRALAGMDIDISQQRAKHVDKFAGQTFDFIITVCDRARENCPIFPGNGHRIHWSLPDPAAVAGDEARYAAFEQTARQLRSRIRYFVAALFAGAYERKTYR